MGENIADDGEVQLGFAFANAAALSGPVTILQNSSGTHNTLAIWDTMQVISPDVSAVPGAGHCDDGIRSSIAKPETGCEREWGSAHFHTSDPPPYTRDNPVDLRLEPRSSSASSRDVDNLSSPIHPETPSEYATAAEARRREELPTQCGAKNVQTTNKDGASTFKRLQENRFGLNFLRSRAQSMNSSPQNGSSSDDGDIGVSGSTVTRLPMSAAPVSGKRGQVSNVNVVIFGETDVGKASVINLIAGQQLAYTSNDVIGCAFNYARYFIPLDETLCCLWDTVGLDEGSEGTVPAKEAENNLRDLMQVLAQSGGIHLVIYCIRGTRLTKALKRNYHLFYVTVCRRKVPVVLVVTGLEHERDGMETWWTENEVELRRNGMWFDAHACITTLNVADHDIQQRRFESQMQLRGLVVKYSGLPGWKTDSSFLSRIMPHFHSGFHGVSLASNLDEKRIPRKVTVFSSSSMFLPGTSAGWEEGTAKIGDRRYRFLRVDKDSLETAKPQKSRGVGLLIFYSSSLVDNCLPPADVAALRKFYDVAGAQICPLMVVLPGDDNEQAAWACRVQIATCHNDIRPHFVSLSNTSDAGAKLDERIQTMCMEQTEIKVQNFFKKILN